MKTQISRHSHRPEQRYDGVFQQQGRMLTDADWNELVHILNDRLDRALGDIIGSGVPVGEGALRLEGAEVDELHIMPGRLYVDGRPARLIPDQDAPISLSAQPDLPEGLPLIDPQASGWLYADVWQRPITAFEDAELADPALHGADTCTRTRTMVQIKWYAGERPPHEALPRCGHARLTVTRGATPNRSIDDCGGEIHIDAPSGNALLRVEVHDVEGDPAEPTGVTLKWSLENGAESHLFDSDADIPARFWRPGPTCYEVFAIDDEKLLGVPASTEPTKRPRLLFTEDAAKDEHRGPHRFVRRWDGFREWPNLAGETTLEFEVGSFTCELDVSALDPGGERPEVGPLVIGDHWLVALREGAHSAGDHAKDLRPQGIDHRYLTLARIEDGKVASLASGEPASFPRLSRLTAEAVRYEPKSCDGGVYEDWSGGSVAEALDHICRLEASHVRTRLDDSTTNVESSLQKLYAEIEGLRAELADMRGRDDCGARLALFGRGVLEGLIPTVELRRTDSTSGDLYIWTSEGRVIDGRGCIRRVPPLRFGQGREMATLNFIPGPTIVGASQQVGVVNVSKIAELTPISATVRDPGVVVTPPVPDRQPATPPEGDDHVEAPPSPNDNEGAPADGAVIEEPLYLVERDGRFTLTLDPPEQPDDGHLNDLGIPFGQLEGMAGSPGALDELYQRQQPPDGSSYPRSVTPPGPGDFDAAAEHRRQWSPYATLVTADVSATCLCIGTLLVSPHGAWIVPDGREAIISTPARMSAASNRSRIRHLADMRSKISGG